jgi:hypothetical protein
MRSSGEVGRGTCRAVVGESGLTLFPLAFQIEFLSDSFLPPFGARSPLARGLGCSASRADYMLSSCGL